MGTYEHCGGTPVSPCEMETCEFWDLDHYTNPECPQRTTSGGCIHCEEAAAQSFFDEWCLSGSYAISQDELAQYEATQKEMVLDADTLGIPPGRLIPCLQELFDLEKEYALRKAAVLRKYRKEGKG